MVPHGLLVSSRGNVCKSARPVSNEVPMRVLPIRVFDGSADFIVNLDGLCVQVAGCRWANGARSVYLEPVSSGRYEVLIAKAMEKATSNFAFAADMIKAFHKNNGLATV